MEYVLDGNIVGHSVTIDGINHPKQAYANLEQLIPVATPPTLTEGQTMDWGAGSVIAGKWQRFTVRDKTDAEKMAEIREKRNNLLLDTDYFALSDVTMSSAMATYRQDLRDLPASVDVDNPVYPTKP
jgi:hypothetical protein|tara:strand:+ start:366 stop:746 length:381 start_codon:yes stop_codon:yes gene_type:complete